MTSKTKSSGAHLLKEWHLATNEREINFTDFEFAIIRAAAAFDRWQKDCLACCLEGGLSAMENAVLHIIRMHDRPKSISDIARLMNRDDISNLQYSLRKLNNAQLIKRSDKRDSKRSATYTITNKGKQITDQFAEFRRDLLLSLTDSIKDFDTEVVVASKVLSIIAGLYDHASSIASAHPRA